MKYSRVVAISTGIDLVFDEGKNGKPELIPRRKAEKPDDGICSPSDIDCLSIIGLVGVIDEVD